jgi:hypothetical protein
MLPTSLRPHTARLLGLLALASIGVATIAHADDPPAPDSTSADSTAVGSTAADLAATSAPPWNPPEAVPAESGWETAVKVPGLIVSLPFNAVGQLIRGGLIVAESQDLVPKLLVHVGILTKFGLALAPASLGTNTGWGARAVAQPPFFKLLKAEFSASTGSYNRTNVGLLWKGSGIDYQYEWRSRDKFFGFGQNSRSEDLSAYALQGQEVRASIAWPMQPVKTGLRPGQILEDPVSEPPMPGHIQPEFAMWVGPREIVMLPGRNTPLRSIDEVFPTISSQLLDQRIEHFIYAARAGIDTRTGRPHWWRGGRLVGTAERFDKPIEAFAFHDATTPSAQFTRYTGEGDLGWSFWRDPRTFRLYGKVVAVEAATNGLFAFQDLAHLGGDAGLYGFESGRFHERSLILSRFSYIYPLARYFEMDLHAEVGGVFNKVKNAEASEMRPSYGLAVRIRTPMSPVAFGGLDFSREKVRLRFGIGNVD